ncbi:endonuclease III domain-containing protein [candidate division KSB1 bacterium]
MQNGHIHIVIELLEKAIGSWREPVVGEVARERDPFKVLIATVLSLRTKDETTREASRRLFEKAGTPQQMLDLGENAIAGLIYPVGFYRNKAKTIVKICGDLLERYYGTVPDTIDELLTFGGVGRKTANLVVTLGYNKPGICVDIHVHRISNRLGYVQTKTPDETEFALREKLPVQYWNRFNDLLVPYGQNLCKPVSPFCSRCTISDYCDRAGVDRSR